MVDRATVIGRGLAVDGGAVANDAIRPRRADAQRNYNALLEAANMVFLRDVDAPLEEIARVAGVGIGTLYRHFPSRDALLEAVYRNEVERLTASAAELAAEFPPFEALSEWLRRFIDYVATKRGLSSALKAMTTSSPELFESSRVRMLNAMGLLVGGAVAAHAIRDDVSADDLFRALGGICNANQQPDWQDHAKRLVDLLLDGLRYGVS